MAIANISGNILTDSGVSTSSLVSGSGTTNYLPKFTGASSLGNSLIFDNGTNVGIGNTNTSFTFDVTGTGRFTGALTAGNGIFGNTGTGNNVISISNNDQSNTRLRIINTGSGGQTFSIVGGNPGVSNAGLAIFDETNSATRLYVSSAGNVGIGVSSANGLLSLRASLSDTPVLRFQNNITSGLDAAISTYVSSTQTYLLIGTNTYITSTGNSTRFNTSYAACSIAFDEGDIRFLTNTSGGNPTQRMIVSSAGNVLVGTSQADPVSANVTGIAFEGTLGSGKFSRANNASLDANRFGSDGELIRMYRGGTQVGNISVTGSNTSYNTSSDYRLKQDFKDYNGLDLVSAIKTYDYEWKADNSRMYGVLAHELQEVVSYAVFGEKDAISEDGKIISQSVDYSKIVPVLIKAIQELSAKVSALENR